MKIRDALESLLECATDNLIEPVCRTVWYPGDNASHDKCEATPDGNGQLWVAQLSNSAGWPASDGNPITCATPFAVALELGIVRCAQGVLQDGGDHFPAQELVTADAQQQDEDRIALKNAILCCWGLSGKDMLPPRWDPIKPRGGCVGGVWTIIIRDGNCLCESPDS